ncbi:hypothetical protein Q5752_004636 [Cryptotrichosporon argae]
MQAQCSRLVRKAVSPKPIHSVRAEPLLEDDFERDAWAEASGYADLQQYNTERAHVKEQSKERHQLDLPPLAVPKKPGLPNRSGKFSLPVRKRRAGSADSDASDESDEQLQYEGQVVLPFSPLDRLAGKCWQHTRIDV